MLLLVHTVTLANEDYVVNARFYHSMSCIPHERRIHLALLGKRVTVTLRRSQEEHRVKRLIHCRKHSARDRPSVRRTLRAVALGNSGHTVGTSNGSNVPSSSVAAKEERSSQPINTIPPVPVINTVSLLPDQGAISTDVPLYQEPLASEATAQQAAQWLQANRFGSYLHTFANFSGADILRLSRNDLIQICGVPDGIRLFNALHSKSIAPCLTVYLCVGQNTVYHALYLDNFSCGEMAQKLATMLGVSGDQIHDLYMQGPNGIHIQMTDEVIRNLKDEALFNIEILHDQNGARYRLLLKPSQSQ